MIDFDFQERYEFVLGWLQRRRAHVAAAIMRLGRVQMTRHVATAAILARGEQVWLYFNPEFCCKIDNPELAGVLTHEALHFALKHQQRIAAIRAQRDRYLFELACEAVINDLILSSFRELKLPGEPITGSWLVGRDTSSMSAEQVLRLLFQKVRSKGETWSNHLAERQTVDDHSIWAPEEATLVDQQDGQSAIWRDEQSGAGLWTDATTNLLRKILEDLPPNDPCYGSVAAGVPRPAVPANTCRKNLKTFLDQIASPASTYDTLWTLPNRKLMAFYPQIILPTYEPMPWRNLLIAIDTSGSVPNEFIAEAMDFAKQPHPRTRIALVSFDVVYYEATIADATLRGGGGTRAQAVEEYIHAKLTTYPDTVLLFTDGLTPTPQPKYPDRWVWILPPWGTKDAIPKGSTAEHFDVYSQQQK